MVRSVIYLSLGMILLTGCDRKLRSLTMAKTPYTGDELRIDGYYYSSPREYDGHRGVAVFYGNGFCIHTKIESIENDDVLPYIEREILLNDNYINKLMSGPTHIGVFEIMDHDIKFEIWEDRTIPFTYSGYIVNDETFIINKRVNRQGYVDTEILTYRFVEFSPKPDPTNKYTRIYD